LKKKFENILGFFFNWKKIWKKIWKQICLGAAANLGSSTSVNYYYLRIATLCVLTATKKIGKNLCLTGAAAIWGLAAHIWGFRPAGLAVKGICNNSRKRLKSTSNFKVAFLKSPC
jgi:hypothetical protein